jgi:hypothetical protein
MSEDWMRVREPFRFVVTLDGEPTHIRTMDNTTAALCGQGWMQRDEWVDYFAPIQRHKLCPGCALEYDKIQVALAQPVTPSAYQLRRDEARKFLEQTAPPADWESIIGPREDFLAKTWEVMDAVAGMDWVRIGDEWYCPFLCHLLMPRIGETMIRGLMKPSIHLPSCGIMIARSMKAERLRLFPTAQKS